MKRFFSLSIFMLSLTIFAAAQEKSVVPIVHLYINDEESVNAWAYLLGGVDENRKFVDAKTTFARMKQGKEFVLFDFEKGRTGSFLLGEFKAGPGACEENYFAEQDIKPETNFAVGAGAAWEILPRKWQAASVSGASYKKAVADALRARGLAKSPVKIEKAVRVDLDGDGAAEVLLLATHLIVGEYAEPRVGSYSMLLLQKTVGGKAQTTLVGGNFLSKKDEYFGGEFKLSGIADFNGDGKMEILVDIWGYEDRAIEVFEMNAGKISKVEALSYYCGV